ncbi:Glutamine synthetase and cystathionine beta-lyase binding protein [Thermoflexales bacterium]|nr:Glutamine synthetase and cystathionine beta-lyase binding protein [Thermoflexales bacterium]
MNTYIVLMRLTDQGIRAVKDVPDRIEAGIHSLEALGGKINGFYATLGEYDYIACVEAPNEAVVMRFLLAFGAAGDVRTTTLKALSREEFEEIARKL